MIYRFLKAPFWRHRLKALNVVFNLKPDDLDSNTTIDLEENASLKDAKLVKAHLRVGAYSYIRSRAYIAGDIDIGRFCSIANNVTIGLNRAQHPLDWLSTHPVNSIHEAAYENSVPASKTIIGNDCWIGHGATILAGVKIGDGAVIGANALITKDVPAYSIVAGNPGRIIRYRFDEELIRQLVDIKWWELDHAIIQDLPLDNPLACIKQLKAVRRVDYIAMYKKIHITPSGIH